MTDEAFSQAARTYGDMIYRVAYHGTRNQADAEDITQTVLLRLYQYTGRFESEDHLRHWLLRVAVNETRRLLRSFWRRRAVPLEDWQELPAVQETDRSELLRAVMSLDTQYRLTIYLYYFEGCSVKEVAAALRANPSTVQTWLQRARVRLRMLLTEEEEEENRYVQPQNVP